jgi:hypothetical protein
MFQAQTYVPESVGAVVFGAFFPTKMLLKLIFPSILTKIQTKSLQGHSKNGFHFKRACN